MNETLETLPGEGDTEAVVKTRMRHKCDVCGGPAHYKHTFLLDGARRNPASSAYGRDDCSWCEDEKRFVCAEHKNERQAPNGYSWCSTFSATKRFAHMFLYWREKKVAPDDCPELFPGTLQALRDLCERPKVEVSGPEAALSPDGRAPLPGSASFGE